MKGVRRNSVSSRAIVGPLLIAALPAAVLGATGVAYLRHETAIAERTLEEEGLRFAFLVAERLSGAYKDYLDSEAVVSRSVDSGTVREMRVPLPATSAADSRAFRSFMEAESNLEALRELIPSLASRSTPAGLPLKPVAQLQLARLCRAQGDTEGTLAVLRELLPEVVESSPSPVSVKILDAAEEIAESLGLAGLLGVRRWRSILAAKEETRARLHRNREQILGRLNISRWFNDDGIHYYWGVLPEGGRIAFSQAELEHLAGEALEDLWPLADNGPRSLAIRLDFGKHFLIPAPFNDPAIRQARFEEAGFSAVAHSQSGRVLAALGSSAPFGVRVQLANEEAFRRSVRERILWRGSFFGAAWLCLLIGFWKTWRTLVLQGELNERQSNLLASVSHELRSPVAGIRLLAERLADAPPERDPRRAEFVRMLGRESDRLSRLIDNILDSSRIADGREAYEFEWIDLAALLRDTADRYAILAADEGKAIACRIGEDERIDVLADSVALQQAVGNLLENALKFSAPGGEVELATRSEVVDERRGTVSILVRDRGCGIPAEEIPKIFELFYRSESELRRETSGTGLGLFLAKSIAEAHGGRLEVASEPGVGSEFRLDLPLEPEPEVAGRSDQNYRSCSFNPHD